MDMPDIVISTYVLELTNVFKLIIFELYKLHNSIVNNLIIELEFKLKRLLFVKFE